MGKCGQIFGADKPFGTPPQLWGVSLFEGLNLFYLS